MRDITLSDLNKIGGRSRSSLRPKIVAAINKYAKANGITTVDRMSMFLANCRVESTNFTRLEEALSYSAERLMQVWPKRFPSLSVARQYARNPKKLANFVYGNRMGNRGKPNAGWLHRGSGLGQMTGYDNFKEFEDATGIPVTKNPDMMRDPDIGTKAICVFWEKRDMNRYADRGDVTGGRKVWNGGTHGLKLVKETFVIAKRVLAEDAKPSKVKPRKPKTSNHVRELQDALCKAEYYTTVDGIPGTHTTFMLKEFQRDHGLAETGILNSATVTALAKAGLPKTPPKPAPKPTDMDPEQPPQKQKSNAGPIAALIALIAAGSAYFWDWLTNLISTLF